MPKEAREAASSPSMSRSIPVRTIVQYAIVLGTILLFVVMSWVTTVRMERAITQSAIDAYQQTEMEIVRSVARSIEAYVGVTLENGNPRPVETLEQDIFRLFVDPVRLLASGDAWIYAPDHVIYDRSGDFPDEYRGHSMAAIFEMQKRKGAGHYEEMSAAVMEGRSGVGWYVWLPQKGREIAAWTSAKVGPYSWSVGMSTPLPEILESTGAGPHIRSAHLLMGLATPLSLAMLAIWVLAEARRRRSEERLREGEERFRSVVDTAPDAIIALDPAERITFWNGAAARIFQWKEEEAIGMALSALLAPATGRPPEESDGQDVVSARREGIRKDGTRFPTEVSTARWSSRAGAYVTYVIRDMSRHEEAERDRWELEQELQRAQRMESLGILAAGVAHDLNNMLTPVVGYAELLLQEVPPESPLKDSLLELRRAGERAGAVVQDLLTLGRRGSYQMAPLDLNAVVAEVLSSVAFTEAGLRHPGTTVKKGLQPDLPTIRASVPHLTKAILNLLLNAFEAMPQGGSLSVETRGRVIEEPLVGYERIEAGSYAVLEVSDTGIGIEAKDLGRIFEPFYTRKKMGRGGSGLGLAVVYGVVHDHQGRIDVRTAVAKGSRFSLWFPVCGERPEAPEDEERELKGTESVLLVDDQPEQRAVASRLLERCGYRVSTAENGRAAVERVRAHPVDILVLDMIMEEDFDGLDCWKEVVKIRPDQRAIIVSGYAETERVKEAQALGVGAFLRKPYTRDALARAIRRELSRRRNA